MVEGWKSAGLKSLELGSSKLGFVLNKRNIRKIIISCTTRSQVTARRIWIELVSAEIICVGMSPTWNTPISVTNVIVAEKSLFLYQPVLADSLVVMLFFFWADKSLHLFQTLIRHLWYDPMLLHPFFYSIVPILQKLKIAKKNWNKLSKMSEVCYPSIYKVQ